MRVYYIFQSIIARFMLHASVVSYHSTSWSFIINSTKNSPAERDLIQIILRAASPGRAICAKGTKTVDGCLEPTQSVEDEAINCTDVISRLTKVEEKCKKLKKFSEE